MTTLEEENLEGKTTSMEDDLRGRQPQQKMTTMEEDLKERELDRKTTEHEESKMTEDNCKGRQPVFHIYFPFNAAFLIEDLKMKTP